MTHKSTKARKGNGDQSVDAHAGEEFLPMATTDELEELRTQVRALRTFQKTVEMEQENLRLKGLTPLERISEETEKVGDRLQDADQDDLGWLSKRYAEGLDEVRRAEAAADEAERSRDELMADDPDGFAAKMLEEAFGEEKAGDITRAIRRVSAAGRKSDRKRILKNVLAVVAGGAGYLSVVAMLTNLAVKAAAPKTFRGRMFGKAVRWMAR